MGRQQGQQSGQQRGSTSTPNAGGGEFRDVAEQMRGATSELQRQSPSSAAERAERAAAQLRKLEEQLRGESPEARQREAGELRLEAQQVADEQRRIAGEAERLEKGPGAVNSDAWRRLAGEKDNLADRVDELQRAAERFARTEKRDQSGGRSAQTPPANDTATAVREAAAAAQEISRQQIPERMREGAKQMREGTRPGTSGGRSPRPSPPNASAAEQQIASALDRVVEKLGGEGSDVRELSRQLEETRAIRDRLDRLERQLREAESKANGARQGRAGGNAGAAGDAVQRLREEYAKEMQQARQTLSRLERSTPGAGLGGATPEEHEWSVTDQGTEAFKQDFSRWESLRKDVDSALERYESSVVSRAAQKSLQDRLSAGGSDRVPDAYRRLIARYYESLARKK
jgi:hypothetical protein